MRIPSHAILLVLTTIAGCSPSFKNVRVFADGLVATRLQPEPIANDAYDSCFRSERYGLLRNQLLALGSAVELYEQGVLICRQSAGLRQRYQDVHALVVAYGKALAELTQDDTVSSDPAIGKLVEVVDGSVKAVAGSSIDALIGPGATAASTQLLGVVKKWAMDGYRRGQVRQAIVEGGPHVAVLLTGLHRMATELYLPALDVEEDRARNLFRVIGKVHADQAALADLEWRELQLALARRRYSARAFVGRVSALAAAHQQLLYLASHDDSALEGERLIDELKPIVNDLVRPAELETVPWDPLPPSMPRVLPPPMPP